MINAVHESGEAADFFEIYFLQKMIHRYVKYKEDKECKMEQDRSDFTLFRCL